ncbi:hypothetical protein HHL16_23565 [Pseudoflavitalea sp. G-6-1-2]|uniref:hypothetical protein n=1 Tax=Pseudoflavitalea sp. G-6-1-2 TaxID=2728841 RepID=UPI00146A3537|nr:hypothetical protein [Pseudoflavitalea sp. G-6-1-2]NML23879.1 hypothetical protein [Pseudoflavitalea sp. G-6-1-2]
MKTILNSSVLMLLLLSCRTVQKATEDQFTESQSTVAATSSAAKKQSVKSSQVKYSNLSKLTRSDNGIERQIEEQVLEYSIPRRDSLLPDAASSTKVVRTTRKIRERGNRKDLSVQQSSHQDSLHRLNVQETERKYRLAAIEQRRQQQHRRMIRRTGVPWYVWAGSAVTVTFSFWFGNKIRHNRAAIRQWQNIEP